MNRRAHLLETLGFALLAAGSTQLIGEGRAQGGIALWIAGAAGLAAGLVWYAMVGRAGRVSLGLSALAGVLAVILAYVLLSLALVAVVPTADPPATIIGVIGLAFYALVLTATATVPVGLVAAVAYGALTRLWRRPGPSIPETGFGTAVKI